MRIYRATDRIQVKIGDITFHISPLSYRNKIALLNEITRDGGVESQSEAAIAMQTIRYSVKKVDGLTYWDNEPAEITLDENGDVSETSMIELMQLESVNQLASTCVMLMAKLEDPKLKGVEVKFPGDGIKKK